MLVQGTKHLIENKSISERHISKIGYEDFSYYINELQYWNVIK